MKKNGGVELSNAKSNYSLIPSNGLLGAMATMEKLYTHTQTPSSFLLLSMAYGKEYPFSQLGSAVMAMSPPKLLPILSLS